MKAFLRVFWLEWLSVVRSGTFVLLSVVSVAWMLVFPLIVKADGTEEGLREMYLRYSLGGVFVLLVVCLLASATGALARERAAKRLQLTMVRPVRYCSIVLGKWLAYVVTGALVLALAVGVVAVNQDLSTTCSHVLTPVLPSPRQEAQEMYADYMKDPETPEAVKKASKSVVLRLLTQRALDHYQTIPTNGLVHWDFSLGKAVSDEGLRIRMRFTNQFEMRQDVKGLFCLGDLQGPVSNITQAVLCVPLARTNAVRSSLSGPVELTFANGGKAPLMLRPRKDIALLVPADGFAMNLLRAFVELVAVLALVIGFGLFLSASLGRPVALFVAIVTLIVGEMSPSVVEQYPDALETDKSDQIGLAITRFVAETTRPVSALSPLEALSKDECIENRDLARVVLLDFLVLPLALAFLAAVVLPRKQDDL